MQAMSEQTQQQGAIPAWSLGWRLNRALSHADISVQEMADELGVARSTISRWVNDHGTEPRAVYVKQWALRTGVDYRWLMGSTPADVLPRLDSDQQPADYTGGYVTRLPLRKAA